jgi:transposase
MTNTTKYIGMDVHKESISIAVRNAGGKIAMESVIEAKANTILEFIDGLRGEVHVTFEEGTWSEWLYDLLKPHVKELVVCDPRRNALLKEGNQNDRVDARKLAELLQNTTTPGVSRKPWPKGYEGAGAQLLDHYQRSQSSHDTGESHLS